MTLAQKLLGKIMMSDGNIHHNLSSPGRNVIQQPSIPAGRKYQGHSLPCQSRSCCTRARQSRGCGSCQWMHVNLWTLERLPVVSIEKLRQKAATQLATKSHHTVFVFSSIGPPYPNVGVGST